MEAINNLRYVYQFPGFVPRVSVQPYHRDATALVIPLRRRKKTRCARVVAHSSRRIMMSADDTSAISRVVIDGSFYTSRCGV